MKNTREKVDQGYGWSVPDNSPKFVTVGVLGGAYSSRAKSLLTHALDTLTLTALCGTVRADGLAEAEGDSLSEVPTCKVCARRVTNLNKLTRG